MKVQAYRDRTLSRVIVAILKLARERVSARRKL
jgi:hypothetical protein